MSEKTKLPATQTKQAVGRSINPIIPQTMGEAAKLAGVLCSSGMVPKAYERKEDMVTVCILHGLEVGLTPMAALQSIAVINGTPSIWGDGALGLVRGSGLLADFEETITGDGTKMVAKCRAVRAGQKTPIVHEFTVADAQTANLWGKVGPWKQYPKRMLQMRARSWVLRDGFADVLRGLHIAEEMQDMIDITPAQNAPARPVEANYQTISEDVSNDGPFTLFDDSGVVVKEGLLSPEEFVTEFIAYLDEYDFTADELQALKEYNDDQIQRLGGPKDPLRLKVAEAYNSTPRNEVAADEVPEPEPQDKPVDEQQAEEPNPFDMAVITAANDKGTPITFENIEAWEKWLLGGINHLKDDKKALVATRKHNLPLMKEFETTYKDQVNFMVNALDDAIAGAS